MNYRRPSRGRKKEGSEKIFVDITVENFPNTRKEIVNQVQYRKHSRRNMLCHILIKLTKIKHKENILKAAREKQQVTYKGIPIRLTADFQQKFCKPEGSGKIYLK